MFNAADLAIKELAQRLDAAFVAQFGKGERRYAETMSVVAHTALERIANSDALYHNVEHTIMVTLVGQEILRGKNIKRGNVTPEDWLNFTAALLCHDIGYVRGACLADEPPTFIVNDGKEQQELLRGASDAALTAFHVDRGKIFVRERFHDTHGLDVERIAAAIELTRFPVPQDGDHDETDSERGLVRAADLIGQLADPHYQRKINALYWEFEETGAAEKIGYRSPADLADGYPRFYWNAVRPYIGDALGYLRLTQEGKQWIANLFAHVFAIEHQESFLGPEAGTEKATNRL